VELFPSVKSAFIKNRYYLGVELRLDVKHTTESGNPFLEVPIQIYSGSAKQMPMAIPPPMEW